MGPTVRPGPEAEAVELLEALGYRLRAPDPTPPPRSCVTCGYTEDEYMDDPMMTDVFVRTADGEEGWAEELRFVCGDHLEQMTHALVVLGFGSHRHGGANFLEDYRCPGTQRMSKCPTPETEED